jgi:hypothetical protein
MAAQHFSLHELQRSFLEQDMRNENFRTRPAPRGAPRAPPVAPRGPPVAPPGRAPPELIDIHELLKKEALDPPAKARPESHRPSHEGVYGISDQYMILDSFLKLRESPTDRGEFRWNFMVQGSTGEEVLGVKDVVDTVIEIQVGPFSMPVPPEVPYVLAGPPATPGSDQLVLVHNNANGAAAPPTLVPNAAGLGQYPPELLVPTPADPAPTTLTPWVHNPYSQVPHFGCFTIQICEAGLQSYSDRNGARHHYEYALTSPVLFASTHPNMLLARPAEGGWDTYVFTDPLANIHGLTLVFRNPDSRIRFLPDCLYGVAVEAFDGGGPGPFLRVNAPAHGLCMGDRVFITGFASGNPGLDAYVNRDEGQVAAGDPDAPAPPPGAPIPGDYFWTDPAICIVDLTSQTPVLPQIVTVFIAKRRMRIPIRLRRVVARLTNYISP